MKYNKIRILVFALVVFGIGAAEAQYFGKNKPRYRSFKFKVKETPNFDIYHYLKNKDLVDKIGKDSEMWHHFHREIFGDTLATQNPVIIYNNHADFQQTNAISGTIGVGTGGVTEAFKNRVVMPLAFTEDKTNHVLGHELVHAFQYNAILNGDSTNIRSLANLPLWMVEGMAEYMSLGREDAFTSMWMRDAVLQDGLPPLEKLNNPRFFPYRYGQAVWAYITGIYGDQVLEPLFVNTAKYGLEQACVKTLGTTLEDLSKSWRKNVPAYYKPIISGRDSLAYGKKILSQENSGRMNVSPSISPNGKYVIFLSEKDVFSSDLYLAETQSGKIIRKISDVFKNAGADHLNLMESTGSWSHDSKRYAYVAFKKGRNVIVVKNIKDASTSQVLIPSKVSSIENPIWDKGDKAIIFSGMVEGKVDLYRVNLRNQRTTKITDTDYAEVQPSLSADGRYIVYGHDAIDTGESIYKNTKLAILDRESGTVEELAIFAKGNHVSPQFDHEGNILFVSDHDGYRNMYHYDRSSGAIKQLTNLATGISGITKYSPCISASKKKDAVVYSYYINGEYQLYRAKSSDFLTMTASKYGDSKAGILPGKLDTPTENVISANLKKGGDYADASSFRNIKYRPKFKLDYVGGGTGVGVSNNNFGTAAGLQGGVDMLFSDILGNHQLFARASLNGEIYDVGGQVTYINRTNRLAYGLGFSHIPQRTGYQNYANDVLQDNNGNSVQVLRRDLNIIRLFQEGLTAFVHYPFSTTLRLEGGLQGSYQYFRQDQYSDYFQRDRFGNYIVVAQNKKKVPTGDEIRFNQYYTLSKGFGANANVALVGDNSFFGLTAPLVGYRYRVSLEKQFGINDFYAGLVDARYYHRLNPFTIAVRAMSYNRFEKKVKSVYPLYVGQMGFVRGFGSIVGNGLDRKLNLEFGRLLGSKLAMGSFEIRLPFTGPKQIALINSGYLLSDLNVFVDSGVAFDAFSHLKDGQLLTVYQRDNNGNVIVDANGNPLTEQRNVKPYIATTVGVSLRVNLMGAMIIEPYYAWSLADTGVSTFGLNIVPGW